MADEEHVALLREGVEVWNAWREEHRDILPTLSGADLTGALLGGTDLTGADLGGANLSVAVLISAVLNQFYSCFISYSSKDQDFAERLHADLQNKGVRCWFAPHDMPIGAKIIDAIDEAIRLRDKVLLILSEHSVASDWVEEEVTRALAEERSRKTTVLFPIRVDDAVLNTSEAWARGLRIQRNIGDFCLWKDHDAYQKVLERVLRDLKVAQAGP